MTLADLTDTELATEIHRRNARAQTAAAAMHAAMRVDIRPESVGHTHTQPPPTPGAP